MSLSEIEIYVPPGIDPERIRIRRAHGETEPAFRDLERMYRLLFADAERRRDEESQ
jgi:hypothetical protein